MKNFTNTLRERLADDFKYFLGQTIGFYEKNYVHRMDLIKSLKILIFKFKKYM